MLGDAQIVPIPFAGGLNERDREEALQPGEQRALSCYQMTKNVGYVKAPGNTFVPMTIQGGGTIASLGAKRVMSFRGETLVATSTDLYSLNTISGDWRHVGLVPACTARRVGVGSFTADLLSKGLAFVNGYLVVFWTTATGLYWVVVNASTFGRVASGSVTASNPIASIGHVGTQAFIFYTNAGNATISMFQYNTSTLTASAPIAFDVDGYTGAAQCIDVCTMSTNLAVAYNNNSGGANSITIQTIWAPGNVATFLAANHAVPSVNPPYGPLSIDGNSADEIFIASSQSAIGTNVRGVSSLTLANNGTPTTVFNLGSRTLGVVRTSATSGFLWTASNGAGIRTGTNTFTLVAGAIVSGAGGALDNSTSSCPFSKPFQVGTRWYGMAHPFPLLTSGTAPLNNTRLCYDLTEHTTNTAGHRFYPMATIAPQITAVYVQGATQSASAISATKYAFASATIRAAGVGAVDVDVIDFADPNALQAAPFGDVLSISGGTPYQYDGTNVFEQGFVSSPGVLTVTAGTGTLAAGIYGYMVIWYHVDSAGQITWSAPSPVYNYTSPGGANSSAIIETDCVPATSRALPIYAALFRTTGTGGTVFYRLPIDPIDVSPTVAVPDPSFADDVTTDAVLISKAPAYTQPGTLGNTVARTGPPSLSSLISHQDRLVGVGDDGKTLWVSGQQVSGEAIWWSSQAGFQYPQQRGPLTALASMDGRLIAWTKDEPSAIEGQGPPDNGQGGGFVTSQIVSDVGCISQRSVVVTTGGAIFQSLRGLERINRSLQVENYFGARVEDTLGAFPIITSAISQQSPCRVVFSCVATEGAATGTAIEWDLANQLWTACPRVAGVGIQSACNTGGPGQPATYTWVTAAGQAYTENAASSLDAGAYKPGYLLSPWIHVQGLTGWQHVDALQILAKSMSGHDLRVRIAYDYASTFTDDKTWTAAQVAALATAREVLQVDLLQPECTAIQVRIDDTTPSSGGLGTGQGPALIGMNLLARGDDGLSKLPEANRQ